MKQGEFDEHDQQAAGDSSVGGARCVRHTAAIHIHTSAHYCAGSCPELPATALHLAASPPDIHRRAGRRLLALPRGFRCREIVRLLVGYRLRPQRRHLGHRPLPLHPGCRHNHELLRLFQWLSPQRRRACTCARLLPQGWNLRPIAFAEAPAPLVFLGLVVPRRGQAKCPSARAVECRNRIAEAGNLRFLAEAVRQPVDLHQSAGGQNPFFWGGLVHGYLLCELRLEGKARLRHAL